MRLVFTKLETPSNYIEVDIGTGTFEEFSLEDLQDSETGKYIQLPDTIPANSIRVKTNSSELESFDMIKEYQITDDEGNILGGSGGGGASGGKVTLYNHSVPEMSSRFYLTQDPVMNIGKEQTLLTIDGGGNITEDIVTITDAGEDSYTVITRANGYSATLYRASSGDITFDCGGSGGGSGSSEIDIAEVSFTLSSGCGGCNLSTSSDMSDYNSYRFIEKYWSELYYLVGDTYYQIDQYVAEEIASAADGSLLYLMAPAEKDYGYTPVPYRIKIRGQ